VTLLTAELEAGSDHLDDAVRAFLAFALVDLRQEREATMPRPVSGSPPQVQRRRLAPARSSPADSLFRAWGFAAQPPVPSPEWSHRAPLPSDGHRTGRTQNLQGWQALPPTHRADRLGRTQKWRPGPH
jgi:tetratricopeptide repeat protein